MNVTVIAIRKPKIGSKSKVVEPNQNSIDALPAGSGTWNVKGIPGLYVRCRAKAKSFMLQRRVDGDLVKETLGPMSMKSAKDLTMKRWSAMKPKPAKDGVLTLGTAIEEYLAAKPLAKSTLRLNRYNAKNYLAKWENRSLSDIGRDRAGIRMLQQKITREHGRAVSNQTVRLVAAVYRWSRDVDEELPEWPRKAAELHKLKPRDWAYSPDELRAWWQADVEKDGKLIKRGVSTLGTLKRTWWLTALFTGARKGSIEALKWTDLDFDKKVIRLRVTKGDRPYDIPMADPLAELLTRYRDCDDVPPSEWVFPSPVIDGAHLIDVRNPLEGVGPAHRLRHTFRTTLAEIGAAPDQARLLMGHSLGSDVSRGYITAPLLVESLRPVTNAVAERYVTILGPVVK
jgi:integrase